MTNTTVNFLRSIALGSVVLYHLNLPGFESGFLGVDIFLVLSGYLMALSAEGKAPSIFIRNRLQRLFPSLCITILIFSLAVLLLTTPSDSAQLFSRNPFHLMGLSNFILWSEASYFDSYQFKPLLNLWSLALELQFYVVTPVIVLIYKKNPFKLGLLIFLSFAAMMWATSISPKTSFFLTPFRIWEYLLGFMVAHFTTSLKRSRCFHLILYATLLLYFFTNPIKPSQNSFLFGHPGISTLPVVVITSLLLAMGLWKKNDELSIYDRLFARIAEYSYPIYLTHFPVITLVNYQEFAGTKTGFDSLRDLGVTIATTLLISHFLVVFIERKKYFGLFDHIGRFVVIGLVIFIAFIPLGHKYLVNPPDKYIHQAWSDRSQYRCGKLFRLVNPTKQVCQLSELSDGGSVLLLGNSHADSLKSTFTSVMSELGFATHFYVANDPLMSGQHSAYAVANAVKTTGARAVVLHYSSNFFLERENYKRLKNFVLDLDEASIQVVLISPVPEFQFHVPKHLLSIPSENRDLQPFRSADLNRPEVDAQLRRLQRDTGSVINLTNPRDVFCNSEGCLIQSAEGRPLYFDAEHLTESGANLLREFLMAVGLALRNTQQNR